MTCSDGAATNEALNFIDDLQEAVNKKISISAKFNKMCICGMGGSAMGGSIMKNIAADSNIPISVVRSYDLPGWVDKDTFVIVSSYSGDTRETLSMYGQAMKRGCTIVAITAGGKLAAKCQNDGNVVVKMRPGIQPRNALGLILGYTANVMEAIGIGNYCTEMKELIPSLQKFKGEVGFNNPDSCAKKVAERLHGTIPVILSTTDILASAMRWKQQINENSKMMSFYGSIPEFNHNEIMGWSKEKFNCFPVVLYGEDTSELEKVTAKALVDSLEEFGIDSTTISIRGKTVTERILRAVMIGDNVSLYLASMNGANPMDINQIESLKKKIGERLGQ
jgi:glucose/mannose-6-phosphate isomerase